MRAANREAMFSRSHGSGVGFAEMIHRADLDAGRASNHSERRVGLRLPEPILPMAGIAIVVPVAAARTRTAKTARFVGHSAAAREALNRVACFGVVAF